MAKRNKLALAVIGVVAVLAGTGLYQYLQSRTPHTQLAQPAEEGGLGGPTSAFWRARVSTLAGDGTAGAADGAVRGSTAASALATVEQGGGAARFSDPYGVAVDARGTIYIADAGDNNRIRKLAPSGLVSTLAGGKEGYADGPGAQAMFNTPSGIAIDAQGNLYVADTGNNAIRKVTPDGVVSTLAGGGTAGRADGAGKQARFNGPVGVAVDAHGVVYVADTYNDSIRRIAPDGMVTTIAGSGAPGDADGTALQAQFDTPCGVVVDADGALWIADTRNNAIRKLGTDGLVTTVMKAPDGDRQALLRRPMALARTPDGHIYIASGAQGRILQLTPEGELGGLNDVDQVVEPAYGSDGKVQLYAPRGMALTRNGSLVISDAATFRIHRIAAAPAAGGGGATGSGAPAAAVQPATLAAALPISPAGAAESALASPATREAPLKSMLWPVLPQNEPHEVVGLMGEVRGNFEGESRDHFHSGLDVQADVGQPVLAVAPVKVSDPLPNWGFGSLSEGISLGNISYIHMRVGRGLKNGALDERFQLLRNAKGKPERVRVRRGARFAAGDTLGTINPMAHVHLDYFKEGRALNPLSLPFTGLRDTVPPHITSIMLFDRRGKVVRAAKRKPLIVTREQGPLSIVVDAYDQMEGNEARRRLGLYKLGYQLLHADGSPVSGFEQPLITQLYDRLPRNRDAVKYAYAANSGITVYGSKATRFAYTLTNRMIAGQVTPGMWDVSGLAPGDYLLRVLAADYGGNLATDGRDLALTIE